MKTGNFQVKMFLRVLVIFQTKLNTWKRNYVPYAYPYNEKLYDEMVLDIKWWP